MAEPVPIKYRAFISYSHADMIWAKWLHRALEGFTIDKDLAGRETLTGTVPNTLRPIFRDRDESTAGHAFRPDASGARCFARADRHLLALLLQEPLRQRGSPPLQVTSGLSDR
jgi:hypothetical protein